MVGCIVTQDRLIYASYSTLKDMHTIISEYLNPIADQSINPLQKMDYKLYELLLVRLPLCTCGKVTCKSNKDLERTMSILKEVSEHSQYALFTYTLPVSADEQVLIKNVVKLMNEGWRADEAKFLAGAKISSAL